MLRRASARRKPHREQQQAIALAGAEPVRPRGAVNLLQSTRTPRPRRHAQVKTLVTRERQQHSRRRFPGSIELDHLEIVFRGAAIGTRPRFGYIRPARASGNAFFWHADGFIVNVTTDDTHPLVPRFGCGRGLGHFSNSWHATMSPFSQLRRQHESSADKYMNNLCANRASCCLTAQ